MGTHHHLGRGFESHPRYQCVFISLLPIRLSSPSADRGDFCDANSPAGGKNAKEGAQKR